ncbi:MAG: cation:proton antiporter, partial [Nanoarchaeota archaeon]
AKNIAGIALLPVKLIAFVVVTYLTYRIFPAILRGIRKERSRIATFSGVLIFCLIVASISQKLGLGTMVGAFIAGIIIHLSEHKKWEHLEIVKELEIFTFAFIIPFFFINIGLNFDYTSLTTNLWLTAVIVIVGTAGKLLGSMLVTPWTSFSLQQTHVIGWGMNSRGAVELVMAQIARDNGLITSDVYSGLIVMAILTTLAFPFIVKGIISRNRHVMD